MDIFGSLERFLAEDLYPYRVPVTLAVVLVIAGATWLAARAGWLSPLARAARAHPVASTLVALILALTVLPAGYYLASPLWTRTSLTEESPVAAAAIATSTSAPAPATSAAAPAGAATDSATASAGELPRTVLSGEWVGADDFHFARGDALIIETGPDTFVLRLENFSVRNGPDLFVYVSPDADGYTETAIELGALKATDGAFNYEIPAGIPLEELRSAVVWCKQFAVLFGAASLR